MPEDRRLLGIFEPDKPMSEMTDEEIEAIADQLYETFRAKLIEPESPPAD